MTGLGINDRTGRRVTATDLTREVLDSLVVVVVLVLFPLGDTVQPVLRGAHRLLDSHRMLDSHRLDEGDSTRGTALSSPHGGDGRAI